MSYEFPGYPKVHNLGHRDIADLFDGEVTVQEKIDGSQLNWTWDADGLHVRSKGSWQYGGPEGRTEPDKLFKPSVDHLRSLDIDLRHRVGVFYRGEAMATPRHNSLAYERTPSGHIVLFDAVTAGWCNFGPISIEAEYLGIEAVQHVGRWENASWTEEKLMGLLEETVPMLGGTMVEGLVFKNYGKTGPDGKPLMGKAVAPAFREIHKVSWKASNPTKGDFVAALLETLNTEARFLKAVQHLREEGRLDESPRDIGALMVEVKRDTMDEARPYILEELERHFMKEIERGIGRGLPEWYKARLQSQAFSEDGT